MCRENGYQQQVVLDAHNGVISTMKLGANWVDMHLLEWMYMFQKENMGGGMGCPLWGST